MSTTATALDPAASVDRPTHTAGISLLAAGPACLVCGVAILWPALAAMGLGAASFVAHTLSWLMVPLVVVLLAHNARRHRDRRPLRLAMAGAAVYVVHVVTHFVGGLGDAAFLVTDIAAVALLGVAALWDLAVTRRICRRMSRVRQDVRTAGTGAQ